MSFLYFKFHFFQLGLTFPAQFRRVAITIRLPLNHLQIVTKIPPVSTKLSQDCHQIFTGLSPNIYQIVTSLSPNFHQIVTKFLLDFRQFGTKFLQECHQIATKFTPAWHQFFTKFPPDSNQIFAKLPPAWYQFSTKLPPVWHQCLLNKARKLNFSVINSSQLIILLVFISKMSWNGLDIPIDAELPCFWYRRANLGALTKNLDAYVYHPSVSISILFLVQTRNILSVKLCKVLTSYTAHHDKPLSLTLIAIANLATCERA